MSVGIADTLLREPTRADGASIHALIESCPPLDLNSVYAYLLICEHFASTSVVARGPTGETLGFISAYVPPGRDDVLFVWQVAVSEQARGQRLAQRMLESLLKRPLLAGINFIETTVGPDNVASRKTFGALAQARDASVAESPLFTPDLFGAASHEDERLLRIGPL